jgi:hypothetical protein
MKIDKTKLIIIKHLLPKDILPTRVPYHCYLPKLSGASIKERYQELVDIPSSQADIAYFTAAAQISSQSLSRTASYGSRRITIGRSLFLSSNAAGNRST